jgi:hypothetical protein
LEQNVDDAGFFENIISTLSGKHNTLISKDIVYGFGWSNGGYMVTRAANLFRAIAPVSGYQVDLPELDRPIGLFMHHSKADTNVQITGCCNDPTMPGCCCGLSNYVDQCESARDFFQKFGANVNQCKGNVNFKGSEIGTAPGELELSFEIEEASAITCYQAGSNCKANTTFCIHKEGGHFNQPSFEKAFPMTDEVTAFFARDACENVGGGTWSSGDHTCVCPAANSGATYCLAEGWEDHVHDLPTLSNAPNAVDAAVGVGVLFFIVGIIFLLAKEERKHKGFKIISTFELSDFSTDPKLGED